MTRETSKHPAFRVVTLLRLFKMKSFQIIVFIFLLASILQASTNSISSWIIGFSVHYPEGWNCSTYYQSDGYVEGQHTSGGKMPFIHMVSDSAPSFYLDTLFKLGIEVINSCPQFNLSQKNKPSYSIYIWLLYIDSTRKNYTYSTSLCYGFNDLPLKKLSSLIDLNQAIYNPIGKWRTDYVISTNDSSIIAECEKSFTEPVLEPAKIISQDSLDSLINIEKKKIELELQKLRDSSYQALPVKLSDIWIKCDSSKARYKLSININSKYPHNNRSDVFYYTDTIIDVNNNTIWLFKPDTPFYHLSFSSGYWVLSKLNDNSFTTHYRLSITKINNKSVSFKLYYEGCNYNFEALKMDDSINVRINSKKKTVNSNFVVTSEYRRIKR
jgi:hypothetical protein